MNEISIPPIKVVKYNINLCYLFSRNDTFHVDNLKPETGTQIHKVFNANLKLK